MLRDFGSFLSVETNLTNIAKLLDTTSLNLYSCICEYYRSKYKLFLSTQILKDDLLGLGLVMHCDINNIKLEDKILDYYFDLILKYQMKDGDLLEYLIDENQSLKNKLEVENEFIKQAWYDMCKNNINF